MVWHPKDDPAFRMGPMLQGHAMLLKIKPGRQTVGHFAEMARQMGGREFDAWQSIDGPIRDAATLAEVFVRLQTAYGERTALTMAWTGAPDGAVESLTHARLGAEVIRAANHFRSLGVGPNDPVLFLALPTPEAYFGFWGAQVAGAVVPVNPFLSITALVDIARTVGARMLFASSATISPLCAQKAAEIVARCPGMQLVLCDDGEGGFARERAGMRADRLDGPMPGADDICACFPTGGTTGNPKLARISHRGLLAGALSSALIHDAGRDQVVPNGLPLFHVGGGVVVTFRTILLGQHLVQLTPAGYRGEHVLPHFWELARQFGFTMMVAVPTVFADAIARYDGKGAAIRLFIASASKLPETVFKACVQAFGIGIHEGYGMTECAGLCAATPAWMAPKVGSSGPAAPFYQIRVIIPGEGRTIAGDQPTGQAGIVAVRGPAVFTGYTDEALTAEKLLTDPADGSIWVDSGDLGRLDEDGFLWVTGRAKDVIIRGGHNIDPVAIENALLSLPQVLDAAAVGMPDARVGELPVAFVQLAPDAPDADRLRDLCLDRLDERAAAPVRLFVLDTIPRTAMNKVFKPELRRLAAAAAVEQVIGEFSPDAVTGWSVKLSNDGGLQVEMETAMAGQVAMLSDKIAALGLGCNVRVKEQA